ncbi:MAG: DUF1080 domain-containing protein [Candidatus Hydrogenedentota bacterium]
MRIVLTVFFCCVMCATLAGAAEWEAIDVPANLEGWRVVGDEGAEWSVADGVITGKAGEDVNSWLLYEAATFADFELEFDFRTPAPTNGGVQFRSHWLPAIPLPDDVSPVDHTHLMYGYQANVETRQRTGSAKLIDENGRGPLAEPAAEDVQALIEEKELAQRGWNTMRVVAKGAVIETWMGGKKLCRIEDEAYIDGYLALQVYHLEPHQSDSVSVQYRNLRIKDHGRIGEWESLFDGESLDGWKKWGTEKWSIRDGAILGSSGPDKSEGYLATEETWEDFRVRGGFKVLGEGNYGLFYHSTIKLREDDGYPLIAGVQGEVEPGYPSKTGWIYESYKRGWLVDPDPDTVAAVAYRPDAWNEIEIRTVDAVTDTWVNGVRAVHFEDPGPNLTEGSFALQLHSGGVDGILWKDLYVKAPE